MTETYTRSVVHNINCDRKFHQFVNGGTIDLTFPSTVMSTDTFTGTYNPKWRKQVSNSQPASTAASGKVLRYSSASDGLVTYRRPLTTDYFQVSGELYASSAVYPLGALLPPSPGSTLDTIALGSFRAKAYNVISPVSGGIIFGELHKTLHDLRRPLQGVADAILNMRRLFSKKKVLFGVRPSAQLVKQRRGVFRGLRDQWLQTQYGLIPTMHDIGDIAQYLAGYTPSLWQNIVPIHATAKSESATVGDFDVVELFNNANLRCQSNVVTTSSVRYIGAVDLRCLGSRRVYSDFGVDPFINFVPTLYELIPYSFLVDYFTNLGRVIQCYMVPSAAISWFNRTSRCQVRGTTSAKYFSPTCGGGGSPTYLLSSYSLPSPAISTNSSFVRSGGYGGSLPQPELQLENHLTALKWCNIVALLSQR